MGANIGKPQQKQKTKWYAHQEDILAALNEDCWRHVLSFVPVRDIVRAERVSRKWQEAVLLYLRGQNIRIEPVEFKYEDTRVNCRILQLPETHVKTRDMFEQVTQKFGGSVVASYCNSNATFKIVTGNCPNLIHLSFIDYSAVKIPFLLMHKMATAVNIHQLKQISFRHMEHATEECISKFIIGDDLQELVIRNNEYVTGLCLTHLKSTNLKSLGLIFCTNLIYDHLHSALDNLTGLTKLDLRSEVDGMIFPLNVPGRMPKLEELTIRYDSEQMNLEVSILESIGLLSRLRILDLSWLTGVNDKWLEVISRGCKQLESLNINHAEVTSEAVEALCRTAGPTLRWLSMAYTVNDIDDYDVLACIAYCPQLQSLVIAPE
ncbi:putative RNA-binding protein EEED8.10 isoform X3 [Leguminivora glycinivorella]|uniref:putative RNA-binding protein EEED8.10 isoform X3 n=1 Tax=Leguminivora glycinivorella TaxID=1035111 RepID=UPI0020100D65|nr:putative RNA-binding protein EEED8.10 isoform X3 [Leguminivora glycinivorella]